MALVDLSLVTVALTSLLKAHIGTSSAWRFPGLPQVTAQPPDQLPKGTLGVFLYHATEDAYLKNAYATGADPVPVRAVPMSLSLYYQISAVGDGEGEQATLKEQILVGCAAKALHDYPVIDDTTRLPRKAPQPPLEVLKVAGLDGAGNVLRISLQPITAHEASTYWTSRELSPRLALYYEVSAALLEPERPRSLTGRVFSYGVVSIVGGAPRLDGAENTLHVAVPGLPPQDLLARPAEVPVGGTVTFTGYNLLGDDVRLVLQHARADPVEVDGAWGVAVTGDGVRADVQEDAAGQPIVPGTYTARVRVIRRAPLPDGSTRDIPMLSNGTPFSVSARIDTVTFAGDVGTVTGYTFAAPSAAAPAFPPDAVQVCVGDTILTERTAAGAPAAGEFRVDTPQQLTFRLPAGLPTGSPVALRLFVQGAESPPQWFTP